MSASAEGAAISRPVISYTQRHDALHALNFYKKITLHPEMTLTASCLSNIGT
jgi:hypothetical protein